MSKPTVIALVNQKGGTGKTQSTENLVIGLASEEKGPSGGYSPTGVIDYQFKTSKSR